MTIQRLNQRVSQKMVATAGLSGSVSVVRELLDNAVDACGALEANHVFVDVDDATGGLEYMSVRDSGSGVQPRDRNLMCLNNTTSKIESLLDLEQNIHTCGFRGEALYLICQLAQWVQITTKTENDGTADIWNVGNNGLVSGNIRKIPASNGTTVKVKGLFASTPVRLNFLKKTRKKSIQQIRDLVFAYSLIYKNIKFHLKFVKVLPNGSITATEKVAFTTSDDDAKFLRTELGIRNVDALFPVEGQFIVAGGENHKYSVEIKCVFPKGTASDVFACKKQTKILNFNNRLLNMKLSFGKAVDKVVNDSFREIMLIAPPLWYIHLTIPNECVDVNIEPEKSDVLLNSEDLMLDCLKQFLKTQVYLVHKDKLEMPDTKIDINNFDEDKEEDISMITSLNSVVTKVQNEAREVFDIELGHSSDDEVDQIIFSEDANSHRNSVSEEMKPILTSSYETLSSVTPVPINSIVPAVPGEVFDAAEAENDEDNDWSRSMFDNTNASLEPNELTSESIINDGQVAETNHSMLNPCTITEMANEIRNNTNDKDKSHEQKSPGSKSHFQTAPQVNEISETFQKTFPLRGDLGQYVTHTIDASPKKRNKKPKIQSLLPIDVAPIRVSELSQYIQNEKIVVDFESKCDDSVYSMVLFEEKWYNRDGFPSNILIDGANKLYNDMDHEIQNNGSSHMNKLGIVVYS